MGIDSSTTQLIENPVKRAGNDFRKKIENVVFLEKAGSKVILHELKRDFNDNEIRNIRHQEAELGTITEDENISDSIINAKNKLVEMFGPLVNDKNPIFGEEKVFVFKTKNDIDNGIRTFKDKVRGIDKIKAPEDIRNDNFRERGNTAGTFFRGITLVEQIDRHRIEQLIPNAQMALQKNGLAPEFADETQIKNLIYSRVLVHEWIHGIDKFFQKSLLSQIYEPVTYWFDYQTMIKDMKPEEKIVFDTIAEKYYHYDKQMIDFIQNPEPDFIVQFGGLDKVKKILTTGKVSLKELSILLRGVKNTVFADLKLP